MNQVYRGVDHVDEIVSMRLDGCAEVWKMTAHTEPAARPWNGVSTADMAGQVREHLFCEPCGLPPAMAKPAMATTTATPAWEPKTALNSTAARLAWALTLPATAR